jgi:hypothetical protein
MRWIVCLLVALLGRSAFAKDDRPNASQLAIDHPWHPREPSITALELVCGKQTTRYELRTDDRGWIHLIAPAYEAIITPFGRFLKAEGKWKPVELSAWLEPREQGLSLRELTGAPQLPETWAIKSTTMKDRDARVLVTVVDHGARERVLVFDTVNLVWSVEQREGKDSLRVTETKRFGDRMLPATVVAGACTLRRNVREAMPAMPPRAALTP